MTISKDLFLSILAMDVYNRGYKSGLADGGENDPDGLGETGRQIGSATVRNEELPENFPENNFYPLACNFNSSRIEGWSNETEAL